MAKIPTTDPFANLFGKPTTIQKTTVTGKIPKEDPFKDLFKKTETKIVETPKVETKKIVIPGALDTTGKTTSMFKITPTIKPTVPLEQKITTPGLKETKPNIMGGKVIGELKQESEYDQYGLKKATISSAPKRTLLNKVGDFFGKIGIDKGFETTADKVARDQAIYNTYKFLNTVNVKPIPYKEDKQDLSGTKEEVISLNDVSNNFDAITKELGVRNIPTTKEAVGYALMFPLAMGALTNPLATAGSLAAFKALGEVETLIGDRLTGQKHEFLKSKEISSYLPEETSQAVKDIVDVADFVVKGIVMKKIYDATPSVIEKFTKDTIVKYNLPKTVTLNSEQVTTALTGRNRTAEDLPQDVYKLFTDAIPDAKTRMAAARNGITIEIPSEKIVTFADKPYWAKLKSLFGISPISETTTTLGGVVKQAPAGLLTGGSANVAPIVSNQTLNTLSEAKNILTTNNTSIQPEKVLEAQNTFNSYVDQNKIPVVSTDKVNIEVIEFPDKTWGYSYNINTDNGISADFISNPTVKSKDEAINMAKNEVSKFIDTQLSEAPEEIKTDLITTKEAIMPKEITHGSRVPVEQISKEGFIFGKNSEFGEAAFFSTSTETSDLHGAGNVIKIDPKEFNLITIDTVEQKNNIIKEQGAKNLADAVRSMGYDGAIYTHPDPKVGDTYIITNKEKLDTVIREKYPVKYPATYPVENNIKDEQLNIIQKNNPAPNEYNTWIRSKEDIKSFNEVFGDTFEEIDPDFTKDMVSEAKNSGKIIIYSSTPIKQGAFVTPSQMEAKDYAGNKDIYSKVVSLDDVAWIDETQGQYAKVKSISKETSLIEKAKPSQDTYNPLEIDDKYILYRGARSLKEAEMLDRGEILSSNNTLPLTTDLKLAKDFGKNFGYEFMDEGGGVYAFIVDKNKVVAKTDTFGAAEKEYTLQDKNAGGYKIVKIDTTQPMEIEPKEVVQIINKEKITNIPIEKLTSYEGAPDLEQVNKYKSDIQAGKAIEPIKVIYEKDGTIGIEDGKHRFEAYKQLGYKEVPTVDVTKTIQERAKEVEIKKKAAKVARFGKTKAVPPQTTAMKIVQKKSSLPIIQNLMVKNGKMYSTNLETSLELNTDLPDGIYRSDGKNIVITDQDINDFPESPFDKVTENAGTFNLDDLSGVLKEAARLVDIKQPRIEIHGLYIEIKDGKATTISTDCYRAYIKTIDIKNAKDGKYILNNVKDISKVISALGDNPKMYVADNTMKFVGDNGQVMTQRLIGEYPDISQVFPIFNKQLSVNKKELLNVIDEIKFFVKPKTDPIATVIAEDNKLILEVNNNRREIPLKQKDIKTDGKMSDGELLMPVHDTGDTVMKFNISYLKDAINSVPNDNVNILTSDSLTYPILVKEPGMMKRITKTPTKIEKPINNRSIDGFNPTNLEEPTSNKAKIETDKIIKRSEIAEELSKKLNVPIRRGKFNRQAIGLFKREPKVIRIKSGGLSTIFHEVGHFLDDEFNLSNNISKLERKNLMKEYGFTYEGDPEKQKREALAEYLRFKMTGQTDKIKEFAPEFDKEFNARMEQLPEIKAILDKASQDFQRWMDQPAVAKVLSNISLGEGNKGRLIDRISNKLHALYTDAKDGIHPLDEFTKIGKRRFGTIPAEADPYKLARNSRGWVGKADTFLNKGTFGKDYYKMENGKVKVNFKGKSLSEILKPIENAKKMDEFRVYLVSKRTIELSDRGIKTGISRQDAEEAIKELEAKNPEFEQASKDLYKYQDEVLQYAKETGLIGEEGYAKIVEFNKYRVPFYRVMEESRSAYMGGKKVAGNINAPIRKIKGSERDIVDPIEGIIKDTYAIINAAERNNIGIAMANLASRDPELGRLFEQVDRKMVGTKVNVKEVLNKASPELQEVIPEDLGDEIVTIFRPTDDMGNNMINVNMGDKKLTFQVDPDLYRALQGLNEEDMGTIIKILSLPAKLLRAGATLSPDFSVRNPIRDQFSAFIYSNYGFVPGVDLIKGMFEVFKKGDVYDLWKISGGENAMMVSMDRKYLQSTFKDIVKSKGGKAFEYIKHPIELLRVISEIGEEATRLGEMKNALEKGATPTEAAFASREITLDFARVGAKTKAINSIVAFWNANVEGTDKLIRSFKTHPFRTLFKILLGITIPSILLYEANKDDPRWQEIPQWQKDLFWIVFTKEHIYRIPKPFEVGTLFGSVPERTLDVMEEKDPEMFKELNKSIMDGFTPGFIPTSLIPIIENITNYSFFSERPIVSEGKQTLPAKAQFSTYTSETAKLIGDVINYSPAKIDNLIQGYTGGLGKYSIQILDKVLQGTGISEKTVVPAKGLEDQPVIKAFMIRPPVGTSSESVNRLYTKYNELSTKYNYVSKLQDDGAIEKAKKYIKENPDIINKVVVDAAIKSFSYINSTRDKIRSSNNISAEDKRLKILKLDTLETEIAVKILKQINGKNSR